MDANDGQNQLHGGPGGFHRKVWNSSLVENGVQFTHLSIDGEDKYPSEVLSTVTYTLVANEQDPSR